MQKASVEEKIVKKLHKHLNSKGMDCTVLPNGTMDYEYDYPRVTLEGPVEGIASRGSMKIENLDIDFLDVLKRKTLTKSLMAPGGGFGMGIAEGTTWKLRFFLSFPATTTIGPLKIGTLTKITKGRFSSKVKDFIWNGYGKLTTLPPGMVRDDVIGMLNQDEKLRELMMQILLKERTITVDVYRPKTHVEFESLKNVKDDSIWSAYKPKKESHAKVVISTDWKSQKDLFIDQNTVVMYDRIANVVKKAVEALKYHLNKE